MMEWESRVLAVPGESSNTALPPAVTQIKGLMNLLMRGMHLKLNTLHLVTTVEHTLNITLSYNSRTYIKYYT